MPVLPNPRHERFVQSLFEGNSADKAYVEAGYKANRHNAAALAREEHIATRLVELQTKVAERTLVTVQSLTDELEEARAIAVAEKQSSAAVAATMGKAKLHGLLVEKRQHTGPNGGPIQNQTLNIDPDKLKAMSDDELNALEKAIGRLQGGPGDGQGGEDEAGDAEAFAASLDDE